MREETQKIGDKLRPAAIDFNAVKLYYKTIGNSVPQANMIEMMDLMKTMIYEVAMERQDDPDVLLMCIRGLLMLISNEQMSEFSAQDLATQTLISFNEIIGLVLDDEKRNEIDLSKHEKVI